MDTTAAGQMPPGCSLPDGYGKEGGLDMASPATWTLSRLFRPDPFFKDIPAVAASGRGHYQYTCSLHLFKVAVDFFFGQVDYPGEGIDGKMPAGEETHQFLADGLVALPGDDFFLIHRFFPPDWAPVDGAGHSCPVAETPQAVATGSKRRWLLCAGTKMLV